jgi:hypothetical protein
MTNDVNNPNPYSTQGGAPAAVNPGKTLGIVGLILGVVGFVVMFLGPIAGLIVSIIGLSKSKKAGQKNGLALAGIIVSSVALIANIITVIVIVSVAATFGGTAIEMLEQCEANPTSTVEFQGQQISCEDLLSGSN